MHMLVLYTQLCLASAVRHMGIGIIKLCTQDAGLPSLNLSHVTYIVHKYVIEIYI